MNAITPYPEVNQLVDLLHRRVKAILQDQLTGMYLYGSLANGAFDEASDIDVLFVTKAELSNKHFSALHAMHTEIAGIDSTWAIQLEVSYIPQAALRRFDRSDMVHPHLDRGRGEFLHRMAHESDWVIQRHIMRERGIVLDGPDLKTLIDPISPAALRQAVADVLPLWVEPVLAEPAQISQRGYQSFFVLSLCRMLYTLRHGDILSKPAAAEWAKEHLEPHWQPLIDRALQGRQQPDLRAEPQDIEGTLHMMRYTLQQIKPTPYVEVNDVLNLLLAQVKNILGEQFTGMYLYGSLASGDFDLKTSDIDFLVVTENTLSEEKTAALKHMHSQAWASSLKRAGKLEGAYVPKALICRHDPNGPACPGINEGESDLAPLGSDWIIQRHVVREYGVIVEGPSPKTLIDPVGPHEIRIAVKAVLSEWWFPMLEDPSWLQNHESGYRAFAVITMCRVLHALETGTIVSKPKAADWARATLDDRWRELIDLAVTTTEHPALDTPLPETLDFIRFVQQKVQS